MIRKWGRVPAAVALVLLQPLAQGMGLRSFVALPVEKDGSVWGATVEHNTETDKNQLTLNSAYGISHQQTLLVGIPYRLSSRGSDRLGDLEILYRRSVLQIDSPEGTDRLGLLAGMILPSDDKRDEALQAGAVFTHYRGRHELDLDVLYQQGLAERDNSARYDISWQYRLSPVEYPEWGIPHEWYFVTELGGRWTQGSTAVQQFTLGLQWVAKRWVIEGGVVEDLNSPNQTRYMFGIRFH